MAFKIKDGVRIGTVDVFNNSGALLVSAPIANDSVTLGTHTVGNYASGVTAGTGISVTGTAGEGTSFTVAHADTSSQASVNNSGNTFIQDITLDDFGHITGLVSATVSIGAGALTLTTSAGSTNTAVTIGTGTGFNADSSGAVTYDIDVGPALTALASTMTGAGSGFLKKNGADTYVIDTNTYLTAEADTLATVTGRGATTSTAVSFTNTTASTSTATGAVVVTGGVGIGGAINVGGATSKFTANTTSTSTATGAVVVTGGVGIGENLNVGGALTVAGNLVVNGTTTTVNSTTVTLDDPIFTLGGDTSTVEITKDRGIETKWNGTALTITNYIGANSTTVTGTVASTTGYAAGDIITISGATGTEQSKLNGTWTIANVPSATTFTFVVTSSVAAGTYTANIGTTVKSKNAFFGLDQSTGKFTFIPQALNSSEVFSGTTGEIDAKIDWSNILNTPVAQSVNDGTLTLTSSAGNTNTSVTIAAGTGFSANDASNETYTIAVGPALINLASSMTGAGSGFLKKTGQDTYAIDTNTYLTSYTETDTLATVTGRGATTDTAVTFNNATDSTTSATGAVKVTGGLGVAKNIVTKAAVGLANSSDVKISDSSGISATVATTSITAVDTWAVATYRSARYLVQITQGSTYQVSEILVLYDGTTTKMTEYAVLESNSALGTFTSDVSGGNARLLVTMASSASATIKIHRTLITV